MASVIRIKRSSGILAPVNLKTAELAYAYGNGTYQNQGDRLFIGKGDNGSGQATQIVTIGGSYFTDMLDHNPGLLRTNSAIIVDSDKKIEELKSGNIHIDGFNDKITGLVAPTDSSGATTKRYVDSAISDTRSYIDSEILAAVNDSTGVVGGTYGGATSIPIITVDDFGRIDSVGTSPLSTTLNISADSGTADSVDLINDTLNFSGSNSIVTRVTDSGIDIRLDSTHQPTHLAVLGAYEPGLYTYGGGSSIPRVSVDNFGIVKRIDQTNILAEITLQDQQGGTTGTMFTDYNNLVITGGNSINVDLTPPSGANNSGDAVFEISVDSSSLSSIDSVGWMAHERYPGNPQNYQIIGSSALEILTSDGTIHSAPIKYFRDSANFQEVIRPHGGIRMGLTANIEFGNTTVYGPSATEEYNGPSGSTLLERNTSNGSFGHKKGFQIYDDAGIRLHTNNLWFQTYDRGYGSGHDSTQSNSSNNIFLGGHLVAKPILGTYGPYDIGEDSSYSWRDAYFTGTVKAANLVLTSGGISVDSGGAVAADSATFGTIKTDNILSQTGNTITIAPNTDSGGTITIGTRYGYTHQQGNHKLDLTNVGLTPGLIKGETVGTTYFGSWDIPFAGFNTYYEIGFRNGSSHMYILDGQDSALTVTAKDNFGNVGADMMRFNTADSEVLFNVDARFGTVYVDSVDRGKYIDSGTYGGANAIPVFTVNQAGLIDSIGTVAVASQITVEDSDSTAVIDFASHNLKITSPEFPAFGLTYDPTLDIKLDSNEFTIAMPVVNSTGHVPGGSKSYVGSSTFIPRLAIDKVGRITDITTVQNLPQSAYLDTDYFAAQPFITNPLQALTLQGEQGIVTKITNGSTSTPSNTRFLFRLDSDISGLASLQVDNIKLDGNTISSTDSSNQLFIDPFPVGDSGDLVIRGNLIVQGTQTTVNSTVVSLNDKNLVLADSATTSATADGAGLTVGGDQFDSTATKPQFVFDAATYRWDPNLPIDIPFVSLDSAVFLNGVALREVMEDHLDNFFGVDSNNAVTITYDDVANTMTWKGTDASTTQKGVSSFDSSSFTITAGHVAVTVLDGGTW
jgi:hypothetical protein|tara:strand:- start:1214 stop:4444 length:3231 start_codon:yes stop_codon:yes gene_type:complete